MTIPDKDNWVGSQRNLSRPACLVISYEEISLKDIENGQYHRCLQIVFTLRPFGIHDIHNNCALYNSFAAGINSVYL